MLVLHAYVVSKGSISVYFSSRSSTGGRGREIGDRRARPAWKLIHVETESTVPKGQLLTNRLTAVWRFCHPFPCIVLEKNVADHSTCLYRAKTESQP